MPAQDSGDQQMAEGYRPGETEAERDDRNLVGAANVMAILGLATVGLTISAAVLLVASYVAHGAPAVIIGVFVVCLFAGVWFVYPLTRHWDSKPERPGPPAPSQDRRADG